MDAKHLIALSCVASALCGLADTPYVINVPPATTNELSEADLEALGSGAYDVLIKEGAGTLHATSALASFAGEIRITNGVWLVTDNGTGFFGTSAGATYVTEGAAIHVKAPGPENQCKFSGEKFYMEGTGPDGNGVLVNVSGCDEYNLFLGSVVTLTGDAKFSSRYRLDFRLAEGGVASVLNANGFNFYYRCTDSGVRSFYVTGTTSVFSNFNDFVVDHAVLGIDSGFFKGGEGSTLILTNGASFYRSPNQPLRLDPTPMGLTMYNGTTLDAEKSGARNPLSYSQYGTNQNTFCGSVKFSGTVYINGNGTGSPVTLGGPVSGDGTISASLTRLQLTSDANTYTGKISVRSASEGAGTNTGFRLYRNANMPPASSLELENAELVFDESSVYDFPPISLKGLCKVIGGLATNPASRSVAASVTKTGTAELYWDAALDVTGRMEIAEGVLRLAKPKVGNPGLSEGRIQTTAERVAGKPYFYDYSYSDGWMALGCTTRRREGPAAVFSRADWSYYTCIGYHGYVWNRTGSDLTWDLAVSVGAFAYLYIDGVKKTIGSGQGGHNSNPIVLTQGHHEIYLYIVDTRLRTDQDKAYPGPTIGYYTEWWPFGKYCGIAYDPNGTIGTACTDSSILTANYIKSHFIPFRDPGDGSLFTVDNKTTEEIDQRGYHPGFSNLVVKAGAAIDLNGNDLAVGRIGMGTGVISNGTLTVKGGFSFSTDTLGEGPTVKGPVVLAEGATVEIDETQRVHNGSYVLLTAEGGITGSISVDRSLHPDWVVHKNGNRLELARERGMFILLR